MKLSPISVTGLSLLVGSCGSPGSGNNSASEEKRAPTFTLSPTEFYPGQKVAAHAAITQGDLPENHKFSCADPQHPTRLVWSEPTYDFALVKLNEDGTTEDIPAAAMHSNLEYHLAPGWQKFEFAPIETPVGLNLERIRAIFGFSQFVRSAGGNACRPKLAYEVLRSHDYHRTCRVVPANSGQRCRYVPDDGFTG